MPKRIKLLERAHVNGRIHEAGEEIVLGDGDPGPHRVERLSEDRIDYSGGADAVRIVGEVRDVPLYEELGDMPPRVRLIGSHHTTHKDGAVLEVVRDEASIAQSSERIAVDHARRLIAAGDAEWVGAIVEGWRSGDGTAAEENVSGPPAEPAHAPSIADKDWDVNAADSDDDKG